MAAFIDLSGCDVTDVTYTIDLTNACGCATTARLYIPKFLLNGRAFSDEVDLLIYKNELKGRESWDPPRRMDPRLVPQPVLVRRPRKAATAQRHFNKRRHFNQWLRKDIS